MCDSFILAFSLSPHPSKVFRRVKQGMASRFIHKPLLVPGKVAIRCVCGKAQRRTGLEGLPDF